MSRAAAASPPAHGFRDGYAAVPGSGTLRVAVAASARDVAFERCGSFRVEDTAARASVVGAFGGSGVGAAVVPVRQRLDVAEQGGAPAALAFTSLPVGGTGAQVLMQASRRGDPGQQEPAQVSLWSLQTAGDDRRKITINRPNNIPAFEFDIVKQWTVRAAVDGPPDDPAVLERLRERVADLEAILRGIVKRIS